MFSVFICEDDATHRQKIVEIVRNCILIEDLRLPFALITDNPDDVLNYLAENPKTCGLYFLDVDLGHEMNGIALATQIRKLDSSGKIIFVTVQADLSHVTFTYKIEALDYIVKDDVDGFETRIRDCIKIAYERHTSDNNLEKKTYKIKVESRVMKFNQDDIMFISSSDISHILTLHLDNAHISFSGSLKDVQASLPDFYRTHKSCLINPKNVKQVWKSTREVEMINEERAPIAVRKIKELLNAI